MCIKMSSCKKKCHYLAMAQPENVFLVSLRMSLLPAGNEVYGKSIESSFLAGNELAPSLFPA